MHSIQAIDPQEYIRFTVASAVTNNVADAPLPGFENSVMGRRDAPVTDADRQRAAEAMGCNCACPTK